jgi:enoyl-CoA hydratase
MYEITLSGPAKNALGTKMMRWFQEELRSADGQPVLVTGSGDAFSAGLNLKELADLDGDQMAAFLGELDALLTAIFHYPAPTAAVINGHAIAGGCLIQLFCDVRIAQRGSGAMIGLNEVALGLRFPPRLLNMIRYRVDPRHVERVLLEAGLYDPETAEKLGLIDAVSDDARTEAITQLTRRARNPSQAYAAAKTDLRGHLLEDDGAATAKFNDEVLPVWTSDALKETIRGFLRR